MNTSEKKKIYLVIICISFLQGLQFWISPLLGQIAAQYPKTDVNLVQMLVTAPAIVSVVVALGCGWLCTKISKKSLLLLAAIISGITGIMPWIGDSFELLFLSRMIYGIALGLSTTLNTAVVADFFHGEERVSAMGIQAASIGAGMVFITTVAGKSGALEYRNASCLNYLGFLAFIIILICLPRQGKEEKFSGTIRLNKEVWITSAFAFLEFFFLITFSTNISMHLNGALKGNSAASGILTGIFSGIQIVAGFILGYVTKWTGKLTLSVAMISFSIGSVFLILFPSNMLFLIIGAILCGFSQGIFIPTGMVAISNAVDTTSCAMASALFTCGMSLGQFLSPTMLNRLSDMLFGTITTGNVFIVAASGMVISAFLAALWKLSDYKRRIETEGGLK